MIQDNIERVYKQIEEACKRVGRDPDDIKLIAVTKTHSAAKINEALSFGIKSFGENKIQEIEEKMPDINRQGKEFHFIGHLQSNKINKLIELEPVLIHSIEKYSTAERLNKSLLRRGLTQDVLIEVNTSGEKSKNGVDPDDLNDLIKMISELSNVHIRGLMTIGTLTDDSDEIRRCFRQLRDLFQALKAQSIDNVEMKYLSMGMSGDFEIAIEEGSNLIRLGSIIFGQRHYEK
ncbi:MAG: YggS family pyridoxal phosphate-dependent enzyme [Candidatus Cloacimonadales bacterium]|jgi:pyridoxal phosphate enzyme (YggS family)|nr:YggS family pyridoxal phosphate-dependent enzyme [Candidatus Cloacimonadota bacterium]MDX9977427.1 YggS family pyridoxal phosphate-dependent enzyme [Candidatus Cloacimonadales bacterium]MDD2649553.1 YggS family pyridoxal phosphate-dependent enzyme [Candidatus Cloacimonadota bacterium]MDD3502059.1 YggS family pyridoxal phosphate-dependent enzyme [Candidatus Cloacimonadota bacterium]HPY95894.1 YggS family pyridoxal phosphate-dependent enzyme [Candidatus Cloacimonadota bacterium]